MTPPVGGHGGHGGEDEATLVAACAAGDADAWRRLVARYGPLVAALGRRMLARRGAPVSDADVDDVVGGVFLALVRDERRLLRRYRPEFRLSTYLGVIVRTEVARRARRGSRAVSLDADPARGLPADPKAEDPLASLGADERVAALRALRAALDAMPPRDRLLLTLRFLEGLDYGQIAAALHVQRESVGQLLHRAKTRLAAAVPHLADWVEDGG